MAEVRLPVVGAVDRRWLYAGGAVIVVIVGYAYLRNRQQPQTVVDETTGSVGETGYDNPAPVTTRDGTVDTTDGTGLLTNDQWARQVLDDIDGRGLYEPGFAAAAIGKYLARVRLTNQEADVVRTAIALRGRPPQGDFEILLVQSGSTPGSGNPSDPPPIVNPPQPPKRMPTPAPSKRWVSTAKYREPNPPWNSTLSGIAAHEGTTVDKLLELNVNNPDVVSRDVIRYPGKVRVR